MSDYATIVLMNEDGTGVPTAKILEELDVIKKWDNGHNHPVRVKIVHQEVYDMIENVENACKTDLSTYISLKYKVPKGKVFKSGGDSELWLVDDPDYYYGDGVGFKKKKKVVTNYTPPKKKRKKKNR